MANFIKSSIKRPGALRAKAKRAGMGTATYARAHIHDKNRTGRQAREAITLMRLRPK